MVFTFQWTKSFWFRNEKLEDVGAGAWAGNLSSGSAALIVAITLQETVFKGTIPFCAVSAYF